RHQQKLQHQLLLKHQAQHPPRHQLQPLLPYLPSNPMELTLTSGLRSMQISITSTAHCCTKSRNVNQDLIPMPTTLTCTLACINLENRPGLRQEQPWDKIQAQLLGPMLKKR